MARSVLVLFCAIFAFAVASPPPRAADKNNVSPRDEIHAYVKGRGYNLEDHYVLTEDGYILHAFRIPPKNPSAPVALLQHGILASAWCWIDNGEFAPGFRVAELGYDVWFTNSRGNVFSRNHTTLKDDSKEFWDFTFDDMARGDVKANIDYILAHTKKPTLSYIGWSQGTSQMFIAATDPFWGDYIHSKLNLFVALSPVTFLKHCSSTLLTTLAKFHIADLLYTMYPYGFLGGGPTMSSFEELVCKLTFGALCKISVGMVCGWSDLDSSEGIEDVAAHFPDGTSVKDLSHYAQFISDDRFGPYKSGSDAPTDYALDSITVPTALFCASHDSMVAHDDLSKLKATLSPATVVFERVYPDFSHLTWFAGKREASYWMDDLKAVLGRYNPVAADVEIADS